MWQSCLSMTPLRQPCSTPAPLGSRPRRRMHARQRCLSIGRRSGSRASTCSTWSATTEMHEGVAALLVRYATPAVAFDACSIWSLTTGTHEDVAALPVRWDASGSCAQNCSTWSKTTEMRARRGSISSGGKHLAAAFEPALLVHDLGGLLSGSHGVAASPVN